MDFGTAIIGLIIIALCVLPFILLGRGGAKRKKERLEMLFRLAEKHQGKIAQHEFWSDSAIGIDDSAHFLYFIRSVKGQQRIQEINLAEMHKCRAVNISRTVDKKNRNYKVVEKLELHLSPVQKSKPEIVLEFYNQETDPPLDWDAQMLEKWASRVNERLMKNTTPVHG